jgi:hypothetical protein
VVDASPPFDAPPVECPPPAAVGVNVGCYAQQAGLQCPGNPQLCDGTVFYDALECNGSVWVTLATTFCGDDAGPDGEGPGFWDGSDPG